MSDDELKKLAELVGKNGAHRPWSASRWIGFLASATAVLGFMVGSIDFAWNAAENSGAASWQAKENADTQTKIFKKILWYEDQNWHVLNHVPQSPDNSLPDLGRDGSAPTSRPVTMAPAIPFVADKP